MQVNQPKEGGAEATTPPSDTAAPITCEQIQQYMTGGGCPTAGALGECAAMWCNGGVWTAALYIWKPDFHDSTAVAGWFRSLGASEIEITHTLYSTANGDRDGQCFEGVTRQWLVLFTMREAPAPHAEPAPAQDEQHFDDRAVDRFAAAMKAKMAAARAKGRYGWFNRLQCPGKRLARMLIEHLSKGNEGTFEDIANFCMMLHQRGEDPQLLTDATRAAQTELVEALYHLSDVWAINADEHKEHGRLDEAEVLRGASRELRNSLRAALAAQGGE